MRYRSVPPQIIHFWFDWKLKNHQVTSTLHAFEPSAPRLQHPGSRSATNLVHCQNAIVSFFALDHAHCHHAARVRLSGNHIQPPKPLNNTKFCTVSTSLCGPFHPGYNYSTWTECLIPSPLSQFWQWPHLCCCSFSPWGLVGGWWLPAASSQGEGRSSGREGGEANEGERNGRK